MGSGICFFFLGQLEVFYLGLQICFEDMFSFWWFRKMQAPQRPILKFKPCVGTKIGGCGQFHCDLRQTNVICFLEGMKMDHVYRS